MVNAGMENGWMGERMSRKILAPIVSVLLMLVGVGISVVAGARQIPQTVREVDATRFLLAFRGGTASGFNGFRVTGIAVDFHGVRTPGGGANMQHQPSSLLQTPQASVILTVGAVRSNEAPLLLKNWDDWRAADRDATTLDVLVRLPNPPSAADRKYPPSTYEFSGVYGGDSVTVDRLAPGAKAAPGGCGAHSRTHTDGHGLISGYKAQSYCVPVLTDGSIK